MSVKTYDRRCYELAKHFLQHEPCAADPVLFAKHCEAMAREFQQVNENWHFDNDAERAT